MVSLARAAECIGRRIRHLEGIELEGWVEGTNGIDVLVRTTDGDLAPCIPENMEWVPGLLAPLRRAILDGEEYRDAQVAFAYDMFFNDDGTHDAVAGDGEIPALSVVLSSGTANDDGEDHPLYVLSWLTREVFVVWPTASPDGAREIEEVLGWANP